MEQQFRQLTESHPWIDFRFDVQNLDYNTWMALGECVATVEHIAKMPLSPDVSSRVHLVYLTKGVQATTAIEGNTLSEDEVRDAIENKLKVPPSKEYLAQEVRNIVEAVNEITKRIQTGKDATINENTLCEYNQMVLRNLSVPEEVVPGQLRKHNVTVGPYRAPG